MLCLNVVFGALLGLVSGTLYVTLRIPPIITSLGVTLIYEGVTFTVTGGKYVMNEVRSASMTAFAGNWYWPALLIAVVLIFIIFAVFAVCKSATVYLGYWVGNGDSRIGFLSAISLCAMGEFAFIIAKQALDNGVVDINFYSSVIGAALVSMITLPIFTRYADRAFTGLEKHTPGPLKKVGNKLTAIRDSVYASLENVAAGTKEAFSNGLANIYFNVFLLIIIEVLFYFSYDIASEWLVTHFGGNEVWWRTGIVAINFLVLLIPCRGIILSLRMVLYIMDLGKKRVRETMDLSEDETKFYEVINPIILASALDILIIIVVPNNLGTIYHVVVAVVVLIALVMYHLWKLIIKQKGPALPDLPYERKEEEQSPKEH